jgi:hypothetical protein
MEEMSNHGQIGRAAMKADMDRKTARKYVAAGKLPSELRQPRPWRTRPDPFMAHWPKIEAELRETAGMSPMMMRRSARRRLGICGVGSGHRADVGR